MESVTQFVEQHLKLRVDRGKSAIERATKPTPLRFAARTGPFAEGRLIVKSIPSRRASAWKTSILALVNARSSMSSVPLAVRAIRRARNRCYRFVGHNAELLVAVLDLGLRDLHPSPPR